MAHRVPGLQPRQFTYVPEIEPPSSALGEAEPIVTPTFLYRFLPLPSEEFPPIARRDH